MWAGADEPVGSAQSSPRQLVRMGPCVSNMLRINNNIQKEKKKTHTYTHTTHRMSYGLIWLNPGLVPFLAGAITFVNLSTQTINACQSRHVSSCDRAVGSEQKLPFSLSIYEYIPSPLGNCSSVSNSKDSHATHATGDSQRDIRRDPNNKIRDGEKNGLFNVFICVFSCVVHSGMSRMCFSNAAFLYYL